MPVATFAWLLSTSGAPAHGGVGSTDQAIQTAWALMALLEADDPDWAAFSRGAQFLLETQGADGGWPKQDMAGVFFRTALLGYVLYRQYFPLHALGLYEHRRRDWLGLTAPCSTETVAISPLNGEACGPGRKTSE